MQTDKKPFRLEILRLSVLTALAIIVTGCATVPPVDFTVQDVGMVENRKNVELMSMTVGFAPQTQQKKVEANATVPPLWKESLQDAINRSLIFRDDMKKKVNLSVRITELDVPAAGLSMTTKTSAIYEIVDRSNGDLLFAQEVETEGVVPVDYAFLGLTRAVESANRAVRNNISDFINILAEADLTKAVFPGNPVSSLSGVTVAAPVVAEPVVTEPVVAEPVVAEPVVAEPVVTEPAVAEPAVAEPAVAEPVENKEAKQERLRKELSERMNRKRE